MAVLDHTKRAHERLLAAQSALADLRDDVPDTHQATKALEKSMAYLLEATEELKDIAHRVSGVGEVQEAVATAIDLAQRLHEAYGG